MKLTNLFFCVFILSQLNAQKTLEIQYVNTNDWGQVGKMNFSSTLISNGNEALFIQNFGGSSETTEENEGNISIDAGGQKNFMVKDYKEGVVYYENMILMKLFPTKDPIHVFEWKIDSETKEILGYKCQKATTTFRGRDYIAYFTNEIEFTGGPWKFDGLPGMILMVHSTDGVVSIEAKSLKIKQSQFEINNSFKNIENLISYEEFQQLYQKKFNEINRSETSESGGLTLHAMPACQIECHVTP